jgi:hypothetical protein
MNRLASALWPSVNCSVLFHVIKLQNLTAFKISQTFGKKKKKQYTCSPDGPDSVIGYRFFFSIYRRFVKRNVFAGQFGLIRQVDMQNLLY